MPLIIFNYYKILYYRRVEEVFSLKLFFNALPISKSNITTSKLLIEFLLLNCQNIILLSLLLNVKLVSIIILSFLFSLVFEAFYFMVSRLFLIILK